MVDPLLATKIRPPGGRPNAVTRSRLTTRLADSSHTRLTLVSAPAGFGKTTLLLQWIGERAATESLAVAWVSLDERDNEPSTFWRYVITSLKSSVSDDESFGSAALDAVEGTRLDAELSATLLLNELAALPEQVFVVLDDYHVIENREIHDSMTYFIEHLPSNAHVVMTTRSDPPLPLARLRARGDVTEVRSADLRFTEPEVSGYLAGPMNLTLPPADITLLAERTEGWAAALQLAGLSLQGRDDPSAAVAEFAGNDRYVVDYLVEEVLERQSPKVRDFLLETSILERLSGDLCDAVTAGSDSRAMLADLERSNLFVIPLDASRDWYRYHHLFADMLRTSLRERCPGRSAVLDQRAARWFATHGDPADAVRHALAAEDIEYAADLMEQGFPAMRRDRREAELARWVRAIPDDVVRTRPVLAIEFAGALAQVSDFESVDARLDDVEHALRPDGGDWPIEPPPGLRVVDLDEFRALPASVAMYRAALCLKDGDPLGTIEHAELAASLAPTDAYLNRAAASALLGLAAWAMGDLRRARAGYEESLASMKQAEHIADIMGLSVTLGDLSRAQGNLTEAVQVYQEALRLSASTPAASPLRGTADMHTGMAYVLIERGDVAAAAEELAAGEALGESNGLPQNPYRRRAVAARVSQAKGDFDTAAELLAEAERRYDGDYSPNVRPVSAERARLEIRRGQLARAEAWAIEQGISDHDDLSYVREFEHITFARLLIGRHEVNGDDGDRDRAIELLRRILDAAESGGRAAAVIEALVLLAIAQRHASVAAEDVLSRAVSLARREGFVQVFVDEWSRLQSLATSIVDADLPPDDAAFLRQLMGASRGRPGEAVANQQGLIEPLSDRELEVLRLLATDLSGPEIARHLHVSLNTMRTHSRSIFRKLQANSRISAVHRAEELGVLPHHGG